MEKKTEGLFAISKAGHDKGNLYVVVREEKDYVYVSDGKQKLLENPKKKNKKHIQIINKKAIETIAEDSQVKIEALTQNEQIKRAIKLYRKDWR